MQPDRSPHARPGAFTRPDDRGMGTEHEVSRLLAAHVKWLRPRLIIETGTFHADTTAHLYTALVENAREGFGGELRTYEIDEAAHLHSVARLGGVEPHDAAHLNVVPRTLQDDYAAFDGRRVDLAFVDSAYSARDGDVQTLASLMAPRGLLFVHDADMPPMTSVVHAWRRDWGVVLFPTPRGLALLQRR